MTARQIKSIFGFVILSLVIIGCSNRHPELSKLEFSILETLERSNNSIQHGIETSLAELEEKTKDSSTARRARKWFSTAEKVRKLTQVFCNDLEQSQNWLKSGMDNDSSKNSPNSVPADVEKFSHELFSIDTELTNNFRESIVLIPSVLNPDSLNSSVWMEKVYQKFSPAEKAICLKAIVTNALIAQNWMITFCNNKVSYGCFLGYQFYSGLVYQNSSNLKPGETLEINAGIGAFSKAALPKIKINGTDQELNASGYVEYKIKVPKIPGDYKIPVTIKFIDMDGNQQEMNKVIQYSVAPL